MGRYQKHIFVCTNERPQEHPRGCCLRKGSAEIRDALKDEIKLNGLASMVRVNSSGCLDACEFGSTIVIYPEGVWYGAVTNGDVPEIIQKHILNGIVVERLRIKDPRYTHSSAVAPIRK